MKTELDSDGYCYFGLETWKSLFRDPNDSFSVERGVTCWDYIRKMLISDLPLFLPPTLFQVTAFPGRATKWSLQYLRLIANFLSYLLADRHAMSSPFLSSFLGFPGSGNWEQMKKDFERNYTDSGNGETDFRSQFILPKMQKSLAKQPRSHEGLQLFKPGCAKTRLKTMQHDLERVHQTFERELDVVKALTNIIETDIPLSCKVPVDMGHRWIVHQDYLALTQKIQLLLLQESYLSHLSGPGPHKQDRNLRLHSSHPTYSSWPKKPPTPSTQPESA